MATKKQKREAALAKRKSFIDDVERLGLEAQRLDREARERQNQINKAEAERINQKYEAIIQAALKQA